MPSFIEERLLDCVSLGFQGGPTFATQKVIMRSGMERRNALRARPKYRYVAPYENKGLDDHALIIASFNACLGGAIGFRFKDWADYQAIDEPLGLSPSGSTPVQLIKTYSFGSLETVRPIRKPVSATVYQNGVDKAGTLDLTTGIFTPTTAWTVAAVLTWTGEFDVPVIFASDELMFDWVNKQILSASIELEEDFAA